MRLNEVNKPDKNLWWIIRYCPSAMLRAWHPLCLLVFIQFMVEWTFASKTGAMFLQFSIISARVNVWVWRCTWAVLYIKQKLAKPNNSNTIATHKAWHHTLSLALICPQNLKESLNLDTNLLKQFSYYFLSQLRIFLNYLEHVDFGFYLIWCPSDNVILTTHIAVEPLNHIETSLSLPQYNIYTYWQLKLYSTTSHKLTLVVAGENYLTKEI